MVKQLGAGALRQGLRIVSSAYGRCLQLRSVNVEPAQRRNGGRILIFYTFGAGEAVTLGESWSLWTSESKVPAEVPLPVGLRAAPKAKISSSNFPTSQGLLASCNWLAVPG
eukprot:352068-Chlamydomonas_euryale.AAC.5